MTWPGCLKMSFLWINTSDDHKLKCPKESILSISNDQKMKYSIDLKEVVRTEMINPKLMSFPFTTWAKNLVTPWNFCTVMGKPELRQLQIEGDYFITHLWLNLGQVSQEGMKWPIPTPRFTMKINVYFIIESSFAYWIHQKMQIKRGKGTSWGTILHEWDLKHVKNLQWTPCTKNNFCQAADLVILRSFALPSWGTWILQSWR